MSFINWETGTFDGRDISVQSDKVQASELLNLADMNDMSNISINPTRNENTLDLFFTNDEDYSYDSTYVNRQLSDHNLVVFKYEKMISGDCSYEKINP